MSEQTKVVVDDLEARLQRMIDREKQLSPEEKAIRDAKKLQDTKDHEDRRVNALMDEAEIPKRHRKTMVKSEGQWKNTLTGIQGVIGNGFLVALVGTRGNGKTQIAVELVRTFAERHMGSKYKTVMQLLMEIKSTYRNDAEESEEKVIDDLSRVSFLVIDEFAKRGETDWENRVMFELIDRRYRNMRDTLLIANQTQEEFTSSIGPSLASRMTETGGMVKCDWESFRL